MNIGPIVGYVFAEDSTRAGAYCIPCARKIPSRFSACDAGSAILAMGHGWHGCGNLSKGEPCRVTPLEGGQPWVSHDMSDVEGAACRGGCGAVVWDGVFSESDGPEGPRLETMRELDPCACVPILERDGSARGCRAHAPECPICPNRLEPSPAGQIGWLKCPGCGFEVRGDVRDSLRELAETEAGARLERARARRDVVWGNFLRQ